MLAFTVFTRDIIARIFTKPKYTRNIIRLWPI